MLTAVFALTAAVADDLTSEQIASQFAAQSLPVPTTERVVICHGFACKFRTLIGFGTGDHAELRKIMGKVTTPEAERAAIAKAVAWYGKRVAPEAGTAGARARATTSSSGDPSQIDCVESSLNTTSILLMLQQLGLLHYHRVEPYVSRMTFDWVHSTAVLADLKTGQKWAFDTWVRNSGELPDVRPLADWYRGD
ncbi:MAG: hypothetical protein WB756_00650 [Xanthobacteraceae bacterium]